MFAQNSRTKRLSAGVAAAAALSVSLAACSSGSGSSDSSSSSSSSSTPAPKPAKAKPVASIDALTGKSTAIKLDKGFTDALTSLKLTPGVVGTAKLTAGSLVFPITGGNVTYFKPGTASPYVIGQVQHEGSGFSLTAGKTKVQIVNLNVDPGVSRVYGDVTVNAKYYSGGPLPGAPVNWYVTASQTSFTPPNRPAAARGTTRRSSSSAAAGRGRSSP